MINIFNNLFAGSFVACLSVCCILSVFLALLVITVKNPVISILFLIGLFITIGGYLIVIGIGFIGLSYLLVYVGAVSILFLFILMLINIRISELVNETKNSIPLIFLVTLLFGNTSYILLPQENTLNIEIFSWEIINNTPISTSITWDSDLVVLPHITSIGNIMYSTHAIWLLLISVILLLAMVGAIVINVKQKSPVTDYNDLKFKKNVIMLQSKINFTYVIWKLVRVAIFATIIWFIQFRLIDIFNFDISTSVSYIYTYITTMTIEFVYTYLIFPRNYMFLSEPLNGPRLDIKSLKNSPAFMASSSGNTPGDLNPGDNNPGLSEKAKGKRKADVELSLEEKRVRAPIDIQAAIREQQRIDTDKQIAIEQKWMKQEVVSEEQKRDPLFIQRLLELSRLKGLNTHMSEDYKFQADMDRRGTSIVDKLAYNASIKSEDLYSKSLILQTRITELENKITNTVEGDIDKNLTKKDANGDYVYKPLLEERSALNADISSLNKELNKSTNLENNIEKKKDCLNSNSAILDRNEIKVSDQEREIWKRIININKAIRNKFNGGNNSGGNNN